MKQTQNEREARTDVQLGGATGALQDTGTRREDSEEDEQLRKLRAYLTRPITAAELSIKRKPPRSSNVRTHIFGRHDPGPPRNARERIFGRSE